MELNEDLTFEEDPVAIMNYQVRQLRSKFFPMVSVVEEQQRAGAYLGDRSRDADNVSLSFFSVKFSSFLSLNSRTNFCKR